jgi:hypothetical protein
MNLILFLSVLNSKLIFITSMLLLKDVDKELGLKTEPSKTDENYQSNSFG